MSSCLHQLTTFSAHLKSRTLLLGMKAAPFFRTGSVYLFFSIFTRAIPFLLLPILTRYIDPTGFGTVNVVTVVTGLTMPIIGMCSNSVLYQRYFKMNPVERTYFLNDSYKIMLIVSIIFALVAIPCNSLIVKYLKISLMWFEVAIFSAAAGMVTTMTTSLYQIKKKALSYGCFQAALMLTGVGLTLLLVVYMRMSWQGRIWAIFASSFLGSLLALYLNIRDKEIEIARMSHSPQMSTIFRLGGALIPSTVTGWAVVMTDRLFLTSMTTLELVGIYSVGVMIAQITNVFLVSLGQSYLPYLYKYGYSDDVQRRIRIAQGVYLIVAISLTTALVVTMFAPIVMNLMIDSRYQSATKIIGWISFSYAFISISTAFQGLILSVEKNFITIYVSSFTLVVSLIGSYLLIGRFGITGAAMANAFSSFTSMLLLFFACLRYTPVLWFDRKILRIN